MVRSVLSGKKVPKIFWPEATMWCVHVLNRSPAAAVEGMTLEEAWSRTRPLVSHFRLFGSIAHTHIPKEKRKNLDDKSIKCVVFGLSEESKAYQLYDPMGGKIIISRDVVFEEDEEWEWKNESGGESNKLTWNEEADTEEAKETETEQENRGGDNEGSSSKWLIQPVEREDAESLPHGCKNMSVEKICQKKKKKGWKTLSCSL